MAETREPLIQGGANVRALVQFGLGLWHHRVYTLPGTIGARQRSFAMAHPDLEKWVSTENIARFRTQLNEPRDETHHVQLQGLLDRELAKIQTWFPD